MLSFEKLSDPEKKYDLLTRVLKSYKQFPHSVLSLGYNDTDPLSFFADKSVAFGLLEDKELIASAKESLAGGKFYANSLTGFRVPGSMQLIYLFEQKIQTLTTESQWKKFFEKVVKHLDPYGLFVFDFFDDNIFQKLCAEGSSQHIDEKMVSLSSRTKQKNSYKYQSIRFVQKDSNTYLRDDVSENYFTMNISQLKKVLSEYFSSVQVLDYRGRKVSKKTGHSVVVCQKGWKE